MRVEEWQRKNWVAMSIGTLVMSEERMLEHIHMMFKFHIMYVDLIS
jgi:hypothetical protein